MSIGYDASSESNTGSSTDKNSTGFSWTHTPVGTPRGVAVFVMNTTATTATTTGVTYGSTSLIAVSNRATTPAGSLEPGAVTGFFLGNNVPTGAQTVTVSRLNNSDELYAVAVTFTAATDTKWSDIYTASSASGTLSEITVPQNGESLSSIYVAGIHSGLPKTGSNAASPGANTISSGTTSSWAQLSEFGQSGMAGVIRENSATTGNRLFGFVSTTADDYVLLWFAVSEMTALGWTVGVPIF